MVYQMKVNQTINSKEISTLCDFFSIIPPCLMAAIWLGLSIRLRHNFNVPYIPKDFEAKLEL